MATSGSTNYSITRDDIIKRALRIIGSIGQGETPTTNAYSEAAVALNQLVKEWEADGMQIWKYLVSNPITMVTDTATIAIGTGQTANQTAPLKILQAFLRNTATQADTPLILTTFQEQNLLGNKSSLAGGTPNQLYYRPPLANAAELSGLIYLYPCPDANAVATYNLYVVGMYPIEEFDASTDTADFPQFYYNALSWGLADQLSYEYGVPYSQQAMITKKAEVHKANAMGFDREEGSLYLQPDWLSRNR